MIVKGYAGKFMRWPKRSRIAEYEISTFLGDDPIIVKCGAHTARTLLRRVEADATVCRELKTGRILTKDEIRSCVLPAAG